jgi:hypothetical protein
MKIFAAVLAFLIFSGTSAAQNRKETARENAQKLREGVLLVRLYTSQNKINALLAAGRDAEAERVRKEQYYKNKELYVSFKTQYSYSDVYFFLNTDSYRILNRDFDGAFVNEEFERDSSIKISPQHFYIAEMGFTPGTGLYALVVKDDQFEFLEKPFPYYIKRFRVLPVFRRYKVYMVRKLNKKLYQLAGKKK